MEFSPASPPRVFWKSRKRSAKQSLDNALVENIDNHMDNALKIKKDESTKETITTPPSDLPKDSSMKEAEDDEPKAAALSERRKALFEPLEPISSSMTRAAAEALLPPPDFDITSYPKGWLLGKRRKLVNVDVVESMRRIAVLEMNRKDREIDGLNEQLEEDARCLEHLQLQLLQERSKRAEVERENSVLQDEISMLMNMLDEAQGVDGEEATMPDP